MAKNSIWGDLDGLTGELDENYDGYKHVLKSSSPAFNWLFSNSHGLPLGLSMVLCAPAKAGKSLVANDFIAQLHASDPEALAVKFDTEFRSNFQGKTKITSNIDQARLKTFMVNKPNEIFDRIEHEIADFQQKNNNKIKLIVIDSVNGIQGRRSLGADSVDQQQIGDEAATLGAGFKRILPIIRKYNIALIVTAHVRAEMDRTEIMKGNTLRVALSWATKHMLEYWIMLQQWDTKEGRIVDDNTQDMRGKSIQKGHKIIARMLESSNGPKNRSVAFTLDYNNGIINQGEEVAELAIQLGIIERPNQQSYKFGDLVWRGKTNFIQALEENRELRDNVLKVIQDEDLKNLVF